MNYRTPAIPGRFGNILYGLLNNYIESKKDNKKYIFVHTNAVSENPISQNIIDELKLNDIYIRNQDGKILNNEIQFVFEKHPIHSFADFNQYFTETDLNNFITEHFLNLDIFKKQLIYDRAALHIRGTDYIEQNHHFDFNFKKYLEQSLNIIKNNNLKYLDIFSDDFKYVRSFEDIFNKYNFIITYKENNTHVEDFVNMSLYKNKIIWNSTFSVWTAYISNTIFKDNHKNIIAPSKWFDTLNNGLAWQLNPKWTIINDI